MIDLEPIKKRVERASPAPWKLGTDSSRDSWWYVLDIEGLEHNDGEDREQDGANYDFIAYARTDIPALIDEIERLRNSIRGLDSIEPQCATCELLQKTATAIIGEDSIHAGTITCPPPPLRT